jgi:hypothetical protein
MFFSFAITFAQKSRKYHPRQWVVDTKLALLVSDTGYKHFAATQLRTVLKNKDQPPLLILPGISSLC